MCINIIQFLCIMQPRKTTYAQFRLPAETYQRLSFLAAGLECSTAEAVSTLLDVAGVPATIEIVGMLNAEEIKKRAKRFNSDLMLDSAMQREENRARYLREDGFGTYNRDTLSGSEEEQEKD